MYLGRVGSNMVMVRGTEKLANLNAWTPQGSGYLTVWHDCSDESSITESGDSVSQVDDLSGNNNHLVQGDGARQMTTGYKLNGRNVLYGDGTEYMISNAVITSLNDYMVMGVFDPSDTQSGAAALYSLQNGGWEYNYTGPPFNGRVIISGSSNKSNDFGPYPGPSIYVLAFDWTGAVYYSMVDGSDGMSIQPAYSTQITSGKLVVQANRDTPPIEYGQGLFAEVMVVNTVDVDVRQRLEGYLAWKWTLQDNLPSDHPYKRTAPLVG